jgi:hypothetical protein
MFMAFGFLASKDMQVIWFGNLLNLTTYGKVSGREQVPVI